MTTALKFPALLQAFFTERLVTQRGASAHTVAAYRDCFRVLLRFATEHLRKRPTALAIEDLSAPFIGKFLDHLERGRGNTARTRNVRLAAIHSFFHYVATAEPQYISICHRVLAIPSKRAERKLIAFLQHDEIDALVSSPDRTTWIGRRDHALVLTAVQTGLRASELIGLRIEDVALGPGAHVRCTGKGRKDRSTPLRKETVAVLRAWLRERSGGPDSAVFPTRQGTPLSRDALTALVHRHALTARTKCASFQRKHVTPHVLRHTAAMALLQSGVDCSVIALWLGHESIETTRMYLHADMRLKEQALARTAPVGTKQLRYRPDDQLLNFLENL